MTTSSILLAFPALSALVALQAAEPARPNIVYLLTDQWRASATGYAGDPNVRTPNLDRLARQSLNFRNAVSVCPVCTPHRAALMTGRFPTSTGMFLNDAHLPDEELCMAEVFAAAGYATAYIGKWHLDGQGRSACIPPERRQGWQYWKAAECDHDYNHSHYYEGSSDVKKYWDGYDAIAQTRDAQRYLRDQAAGAKPFVLLVSYGSPHFPHASAPAEFKQLYPPAAITLPANVPAALEAAARKEAQGYYAHCTALDGCVGDILTTLDETGLAGSTILVFTSDHGEMLGSHDCPPCMKQAFWSESAAVPFLLRHPALHGQDGRVLRMPLTTPDILPTLLGLTGVAVPACMEGEDLSPLLRAGRDAEDRVALYMNVAPFDRRRPLQEYRALRSSRYTYVRGLDGPQCLFDDDRDPLQMNNLIADPGQAAIRDDHDRRLREQLARIRDDFRPAAAHIAEWGYRVADHGSVPYNDKHRGEVQTPKRR